MNRGQWLTSARVLRKDLGGSIHTVLSSLGELREVGAVELQAIPRSKNCNGGVAESATGGRSKNCNADCVMATLVTVAGLSVAADPVAENATINKEQASPVSLRDQREWERAEAILAAEGR